MAEELSFFVNADGASACRLANQHCFLPALASDRLATVDLS